MDNVSFPKFSYGLFPVSYIEINGVKLPFYTSNYRSFENNSWQDLPSNKQIRRDRKAFELVRNKKDFPFLKNRQYKMEWQDSVDQILCGSSCELHASNPSWTTITGTTPASLKCQASTVAPFMAIHYPSLFPRVRPGFDMYLQDSGVWWEPGAAMQFNAKVWLEFQPFLHDYQFNSTRITDVGDARFKKLANLARAAQARISKVEHNPHAPNISLMASPKDASELLAIFPTADSIIGQALWRVPFGCDYLLQILVKLIQITTLKSDFAFCNQIPQYPQTPSDYEVCGYDETDGAPSF